MHTIAKKYSLKIYYIYITYVIQIFGEIKGVHL